MIAQTLFLLAAFLLAAGLSAALPVTPNRLPALVMGFYWFVSFLAQSFAFPLFLVSAFMAFAARAPQCWLALAAGAAFAFVHVRNRRAGRLLLKAAGAADCKIPFHAGLIPFATGAGSVRRIKDFAYGPHNHNRLDLIVGRATQPRPMPILIHLPGGAWVTGSRNQQGKPLLHHLAARGWLCADVSYRLGPDDRGPTWIEDVLRAIAWLRQHAGEHGGDPGRIAITGGSAGGHLAALAALAHDDPSFKPGFEDADCSVFAAIPLYGRYDFLDRHNRLGRNHKAVIENFMAKYVMPAPPEADPDLWHAVSPVDRLRPDAPPMLIVHGSGDTMLPHLDARDFAAQLGKTSSSPVTYVELPGIQHAWDMANSALAWAQARAVEAFLTRWDQPA